MFTGSYSQVSLDYTLLLGPSSEAQSRPSAGHLGSPLMPADILLLLQKSPVHPHMPASPSQRCLFKSLQAWGGSFLLGSFVTAPGTSALPEMSVALSELNSLPGLAVGSDFLTTWLQFQLWPRGGRRRPLGNQAFGGDKGEGIKSTPPSLQGNRLYQMAARSNQGYF